MIASTLSRAHAAAKAGRIAEAREAMQQLAPYAARSVEVRRALEMLDFLTGGRLTASTVRAIEQFGRASMRVYRFMMMTGVKLRQRG